MVSAASLDILASPLYPTNPHAGRSAFGSPTPDPRPLTSDYAGLFRRRVLQNIRYWRDFVAGHTGDIATLDGEREIILNALAYALELRAEAWSLAYEVMMAFSPHLERRGSWEGWNPLLERAIRQAEQAGDLAAAVNLSTLLARLCQRQSRPADTIRHYRRVMRLARQLNDAFSLGRACTNLGYLYIERGQWRRAEILCCCALTLFEWIHSDHGCAHTENHLGLLYTRQGLWEQARQRLERACALWQAMGDAHGLMRGWINQGMLYPELEQPDAALVFLEKALPQARLTGEESEIGKIYLNMGFAHWLKGESAQAEVYSRQAEAIFRRFSHSIGLADAWSDLGQILVDQGRWQEAESHLKASLDMWCMLGDKFGEIRTALYLVRYDLVRGDSQRATARLNELESLIQQHSEPAQRRTLQALCTKYWRSLRRDSTKTTEVAETSVVE